MPAAANQATVPTTAPVTIFLMPLSRFSRKKWISILRTFITALGLAQGCGAPSERSLPGGSVEKSGERGGAAADGGRRSGPLRVLVDGEPQSLGPDGDLWGARIARL